MFFHHMNGSRSGGGAPVDTSLYDALGVRPDASDDEIKRSYRQLAKTYHPDKNAQHGDRFKEISYAYEILSNPERRRIYDARGLDGLKDGGGGHGGFGDDIFAQMFGGAGGGGHPFSSLFGGGGGGRRRRMKGHDVIHPLRVSLEDLYNGKTSKLQLLKQVICSACKGAGGKEGATQECRGCRGRGIKVIVRQLGPGMVQQMQTSCPDCSGEGHVIADKDKCKKCAGKKTVQEQKILEVHVTPGMHENQKIPFQGEGDQEPGIEPGDVIIVLQLKEHDSFTRRGDDLIFKKTVSLTEALCGVSFVIKHLDGRNILLTTKCGDVIEPGSVRGIVNEGMPQLRFPEQKGTLFVKFDVEFPDSHFLNENPNLYKILESLLPQRPRTALHPKGDHVEEVSLMPFDEQQSKRTGGSGGGGKEAYHNDDDSDDEDGPRGGGGNVRCAQS